MSKKWIYVVLSIVLVLAMVVGACGNGQETPSTAPSKAPESQTPASETPTEGVQAPTGEPIVVGVMYPISGANADAGGRCKTATEIALKEVNDAGGVYGRPLEVIFYDDESQPTVAVANAEKLCVQDKVDIITGTYNSSCALAYLPITAREKVPVIITVAASKAITRPDDGSEHPYHVRCMMGMPPLGENYAYFMVKYFGENKKVAVIHENTDYGLDFGNLLKSALEKYGYTFKFYAYNPGDTDFMAQLTQIKNSDADFIASGSNMTEAAIISQQRKQIGLDLPFIASGSFQTKEYLALAGKENAEGIYTHTLIDPVNGSDYTMAFVNKWQELFGYDPDMFSAHAYDSIKCVAATAKLAYETNGDKWFDNQADFRQALAEAMWKIEIEGVMGTIKFNKYGESPNNFHWLQWKDGELDYIDVLTSADIIKNIYPLIEGK